MCKKRIRSDIRKTIDYHITQYYKLDSKTAHKDTELTPSERF